MASQLSTPHLQDMHVEATHRFNSDTLQLRLRPSQPFHFKGGQYVLLGFNESELKPFSIANATHAEPIVELHIRDHDQTPWMQQIFALQPGDTLKVKGPNPQYALDWAHLPFSETPIFLIAGGTGFAPMKAVLDELLAMETTPPIHFYWGARTQEDLYLHATMQSLAEKNPRLHYQAVLSEASIDERPPGLVHKQVLVDYPDLSGVRVLVCGPWPMQEAAKADFIEAGLEDSLFN